MSMQWGGEGNLLPEYCRFSRGTGYEVMAQILAGGAAKVKEAGAVIAGGHTVTNPEPFYGLSVTGLIHPERIVRKGAGKSGSIHAGTLVFFSPPNPWARALLRRRPKSTGAGEGRAHRLARKAQGKPDCNPIHLQAAINSMLLLNRAAAQAGQVAEVQSGTDITGFGLLGHAAEMAGALTVADCGLRIRADLPALPGVWTRSPRA